MKERASWIKYKNKRILYFDGSDQQGNDFTNTVKQAKELMKKEISSGKIPETLLILTNMTNSRLSKESRDAGDDFIKFLVEKGMNVKDAIFGITGIQKVIAKAVKKDIHFAKDIEDAKEWLIAQ